MSERDFSISVDFLRRSYRAMQDIGGETHKAFAREALALAGGSEPEDFIALAHATRSAAAGAWERTLEARPEVGSAELGKSMSRDLAVVVAGCAAWASLGCPLFGLTQDFHRSIALTDFGDASEERLPLPLNAFVMRFPEAVGPRGATGVFVYPLFYVKEPGLMRMTTSVPDLARQSYTQFHPDTQLRDFLGEGSQMDDLDPVERAASEDLGQTADPSTLRACRRVLANTCVYISESGGLPPAKHQHGAPPAPVEREHAVRPVYRVGRPIKLTGVLREALEQRQGGAGWKLAQRFVVRGHWRNQAHGPGRSLRRRQWIQPFWKGPATLAEALERTFEVG